jgi:hypothetical protein
MASFHMAGSTPGGESAAGPGAAGTPCSLRHCANEPWPVGVTEVVDCCAGGLDEHPARIPA